MLQKFPAVGHESSICRVDGHPDLRRYKSGGFFIWFRCILFSALPEVNGPAGIFGACLGSGESTLRIAWPVQGKAIARRCDSGHYRCWAGCGFYFYSEFFTPAGVKAKGFKRSVEPISHTADPS